MPIRIPQALPAGKILTKENIFVMTDERAIHQDIRPLQVLIVNLMPKKSETETQLMRLLSHSPLQINVELLQMKSHEAKHTSSAYLKEFYKTFQEIDDHFYDGMIITGAPVEQLAFEEVDYWEELVRLFEWSRQHVFSTIHICWGAQAGLYYHYGIEKYACSRKISGVYAHQVLVDHHPLLQGFDDKFYAPHSRYTENRLADITATPELELLASSDEVGALLIGDQNQRDFYILGHCEYGRETLKEEYQRDLAKGLAVNPPEHYFPNDDPDLAPKLTWNGAASLLYANWLNAIVYQNTPYDLEALTQMTPYKEVKERSE